jgi:hypothetical protein
VNAESTTWLLAAPLFNKFTPLEEGELRTAINQLALQVRVTLCPYHSARVFSFTKCEGCLTAMVVCNRTAFR